MLTHTPLPSSLGVGGFERAAPTAADPERVSVHVVYGECALHGEIRAHAGMAERVLSMGVDC